MKWCDSGLSKLVNEQGTFEMRLIQGTNNWLPPELLRQLRFNAGPLKNGRGNIKSDVFAAGLVVGYFILDGKHPFGSRHLEIQSNIDKRNPVNLTGWHWHFFNLISYFVGNQWGRIIEIIHKMLEDQPESRITSSEVVNLLQSIC